MPETDLKKILQKKVNVLTELRKKELKEGSSGARRRQSFGEIKGYLRFLDNSIFQPEAHILIGVLTELETNPHRDLIMAIEPLVKLEQKLPHRKVDEWRKAA